jgi:polysaccharide biosynthesis/export protein
MPGKEVTMFPRSLLAGFGLIVFLSAAGVVTRAQQTADKVSPVPEATQGNGGESETVGQAPTLQRRSRYQLRLSDVLALSFPFAPEFDQTATVQPDGYITLRGVGSIRVEGQTIPLATLTLRNAYAKFMHDPVITVELRDFERPYFIVGGEVGHTGKFDLRGETTIVEAVAIAGGFRESAKHSEVQHFHRVENGWLQAESVNVKKLIREGNLEEAAYLQSGDFLYVPKSTFSKIARFIPSTSLGAYVNPYQAR